MSNTISVSGTGAASAAPNLAIVDLGVEVFGQSLAATRSKATAAMQAVTRSLRDSGLGDADLTTTGYSIKPEYDHRNGPRLRGYRVASTLQARIASADDAGGVIDSVVAAGGEHVVVRGLRFAHRDEAALAAAARTDAWRDARNKAEQLATLAGVTLGSAISISEQPGQLPGPMPRMMAMEAAGAPPIETGELAVEVAIRVEFAID
jgi:uncharacterized protein YggE